MKKKVIYEQLILNKNCVICEMFASKEKRGSNTDLILETDIWRLSNLGISNIFIRVTHI